VNSEKLGPQTPITNRAALWEITTAHSSVDMHSGSLGVLLPFLIGTLHLNYTNAAAIITVNQIVMALAQPVFGFLGDRKPSATVIWVGCLLTGLGMISVLWMPNYPLVVVAVIVSGLGSSMFHPEALSRARSVIGAKTASSVGVFFSGGNVGSALGPILAIPLIEWLGEFGALFLLVPTALALLGLHLKWNTINARRSTVVETTKTSSAVLRHGLVAFLMLLIAVRGLATTGLVTFMPLYFKENHQLGPLGAAWLVTITSLAGVFGTLWGGAFADRFGRRPVMALSILVEFVALYGFLHLEGIPRMVAVGIAGASLTVAWPIIVVMMQEAMPANLDLAAGLSLGTGYAASGLGVALLGVLADRSSVNLVMTVLAWLPLLSLVLIVFVPERPENTKTIPDKMSANSQP
jgi:MFS transporter, FSR family, fosmidomycin resistance protein